MVMGSLVIFVFGEEEVSQLQGLELVLFLILDV